MLNIGADTGIRQIMIVGLFGTGTDYIVIHFDQAFVLFSVPAEILRYEARHTLLLRNRHTRLSFCTLSFIFFYLLTSRNKHILHLAPDMLDPAKDDSLL